MKLSITYHGGNFPNEPWMASLDEDNGTPAFDGSGASIEAALCDLVVGMGRYLERKDSADDPRG